MFYLLTLWRAIRHASDTTFVPEKGKPTVTWGRKATGPVKLDRGVAEGSDQ